MRKFRLLSFEYENFSEKNNYEFSPENQLRHSFPYSTLLIGPNGTGKSRLLRALADAFNDLYLFFNDGNNVKRNELFVTKKEYVLTYLLDGKKYKFIKTGWTGLSYEINDKPAHPDEMKLPSKLICISYNISDKFPVTYSSPLVTRRDRYDNDFYSYLGIKVHRNSATPSGHIYRTLDLLTSSIENPNFNENVKIIFDFLNLQPTIRIEYSTGFITAKDNFLTGELTLEKFKKIVSRYRQENRVGFNFSTFEKLLEDKSGILPEFIEYLNSLSKRKGKRTKQSIEFDFSKINFISRRVESEYKFLNLARKLKIISYSDILLRNSEQEFSFKDSSSGQAHILTSMLSLASVIKDSSIVLIDEPETSLHPNWQLKYFELINKAFKEFDNCHFIVASHSHFLGSDLRPTSSSILSLTLNSDSKIESGLLPYETFGWSAEQILLSVFKTPTTRNYYVAERVGDILDLLSKSKRDEKTIKQKVKSLKADNLLQLSDEDPLKDVIVKLINKYAKD
jgi:predicted ATP-binding protein involved in virulence